MTPDVVTVRPSADEAEVTHLMQQHRIKSIPVVQGQRLLGVVSVTDILRAKVREDASIAKDVQDQLLEWAGDTDAWEIEVHDGVVTIDSHLAGEKHRALRRLAETIPGVVRVRQEPSDPSPAADLRAG